MKLYFTIPYRTQWGETIGVELTLRYTNQKSEQEFYTLSTHDGELWEGEIILNAPTMRSFSYCYVSCIGQQIVRREWHAVPRNFNADARKEFYLVDHWRDVPVQSWLYSSAFTQTIAPHHIEKGNYPYYHRTLILKVKAPQLKAGQALAILGDQAAVGNWNPAMLLRMKEHELHEWSISLSADGLSLPLSYKYVTIDAHTNQLIEWEGGDNRIIQEWNVAPEQVIVVTDGTIHIKEDNWRGAGVVIPLFSLRSQKSYGVGDFGDLCTLIDWIASNKLKALQLLPINDTTITHTWVDSYPYNSISIYALHPQYIDLTQLPALEREARMHYFRAKQQQLNALDEIDYEAVNRVKREYLWEVYLQEGDHTMASKAYRQYFDENETWLMPYAAFSLLRDKYQSADFNSWPQFNQFDRVEFKLYCQDNPADLQILKYYFFVQFLLHNQLSRAHEYARSKGVILKGDIPIGISRHSVEAWIEANYFNIDCQAGAPPDDFSEKGQNWGFPTYNWQAMKEDGYQWWVTRFRKMATYFDAYRIDHILGFFRIWEIPTTAVDGLLGQFSPALPMSESEITSYGLTFRKQFMTQPYISNEIVENCFGPYASYVKEHFLLPTPFGLYQVKPAYDTQRKVEAHFATMHDEESSWIREGLYTLLTNVLFVEDHRQPQRYHPRINAQKTSIYQTLSPKERIAFDRIHEDFYYHRHNDFWYKEAISKLPTLIQATDMLVCAEDLGMVPDCVAWVMDTLRILTLEIQTMPKKMGVEFGALEQNPYRSVSTLFTHDMPTLRGWWKEDYERAQRYYNNILYRYGEAPTTISASLCQEIVARHLHSPSMLALISWQDWLAIDDKLRRSDIDAERINVPANPKNYWRYRMHLTLEQLLHEEELNKKIQMLVVQSGRANN